MRSLVHIGGYRWEGDTLVIRGDPGAIRYYEPRDGLFRDFARLEPTKDGILDFADAHGFLYTTQPFVASGSGLSGRYGIHDDGIPFDRLCQSESLREWQKRLKQMSSAVGLWEWIERGNRARLRDCIVWESDTQVTFNDGGPIKWIIANEERDPQLLTQLRRSKILMPARLWLYRQINKHLGPAVVSLEWAPAVNEYPALQISATRLIDELWLQFARAVSAGQTYRTCKACGTSFLAVPKQGPKQVYCSDKCKSRAYRRRQKL